PTFRLTLGAVFALLVGCGPSPIAPPVPDAAPAPDAAGHADAAAADGPVIPDAAPSFGTGGTWRLDEGAGASASGDPLRGAPAWTGGKINTALQLDGQAD